MTSGMPFYGFGRTSIGWAVPSFLRSQNATEESAGETRGARVEKRAVPAMGHGRLLHDPLVN